jgi:hypothetical protein
MIKQNKAQKKSSYGYFGTSKNRINCELYDWFLLYFFQNKNQHIVTSGQRFHMLKKYMTFL